ncbi:hypothetical protein HHI36_004696 [Cryptolaemus montrouzieri]|uniref:Uncharacterized protein n=1 Tax=Cryptolaemus montrouzieri TaxID=559131 RepID=A0ABD2NRY6_9CUCU
MFNNIVNNFKIVQWNIRLLKSNYNHMCVLLAELDPGIISLSETFLKENDMVRFKRYNIIRVDREDDKDFENIVGKCADESIPILKKTGHNKYRVIWWDAEMGELVKEKREAFRKYVREPSRENYVKAKRIKAKVKITMKKKKISPFEKFCESISFKDSKKTWRMINKFNGNKNPTNITEHPPSEVLLQLMKELAPGEDEKISCLRIDNNIQTPYSCMYELNMALRLKKDTAPGLNALSYSLYRNIPHQGNKNFLRSLITYWIILVKYRKS